MRPLLSNNVTQLEELFEAERTDADALMELEAELTNRRVPRAVTLLAKVRAALKDGSTSDVSRSIPIQRQLFDGRPATASMPANAVPLSQTPAKPAPPPVAEIPAMPVEEAYKILHATPGSSWAAIEETRRKLVERSHPDNLANLSAEKRTGVRSGAKRANAAYRYMSTSLRHLEA